MRLVIAITLLALALLARGQQQGIPALGSHLFDQITSAQIVQSDTFPHASVVSLRNYSLYELANSRVLLSVGYRIAVANASSGNTTAGAAAFDVIVGVFSDLADCAVGAVYYGARAGWAYNSDSNAAFASFSEAAFGFATRFLRILEWVDKNNDGQFTPGNNELVGGYDLTSALLPWNPTEYGRVQVASNVYINYVQAETADGVFGIRVTTSGEYVQLTEGTYTYKINPSTFKISISIRYYNNPNFTSTTLYAYAPSSDPNAKVALLVAIGAFAGKAGVDATVNQGAGQVDFNGNTQQNIAVKGHLNTGGFAWAGSAASVDSSSITGVAAVAGAFQTSEVVDTVNVTGSFGAAGAYAGWKFARLGIFSFNQTRPSSIVWDPTVSTTDSPAAALVPAFALVLLALLGFLF